jgi:hypothetical protein
LRGAKNQLLVYHFFGIDLHGDISRITFSEFPGREVPDRVQRLVWNRVVENLDVLVAPVAVDHAAVPLLRRDPHLCQQKQQFLCQNIIKIRQSKF